MRSHPRLATLNIRQSLHPELDIAVNVSAQEFLVSCTLVQRVGKALVAHKLPSTALELEITKSVFLHLD